MACANCETYDMDCENCMAYGHLPCKGVCAEGQCELRFYCYRNMEIEGAVRVFDSMTSEVVVIEAHDAKEANQKAKRIAGIRFVGGDNDPEPEYRYIGAGLSVGMNDYSSLFCIKGVHIGDPFSWTFEPRDGVDAWIVSSLDEIDEAYIFHAVDGTTSRKGVPKLTEFEYNQYYSKYPTEFAEWTPM